MTPDELWAARRERARRWVQAGAYDLRGYVALHADDETEQTLAAAPPDRSEKKPKVPPSEQAKHSWTIEEATRWVKVRVADAREEYRQKGAPLGDTDAGFLAWLTPRHQPPTA